jgi:hypothetical protein
MRRLAAVGTTRLNPVGRSKGDIQFLSGVSVEIAEQDAEGAILIAKPSFKGRRDTLTGIVLRSRFAPAAPGEERRTPAR